MVLTLNSICLHCDVDVSALPTLDLDMEYDHHRHQTYRQRIERDSKRFKAADRNGDEKLDRDDFADFLHPGE